MLCFERKPMITVFLILIVLNLIEVTSGLLKSTPEHQHFKRRNPLQKCPPGKYKVTSHSSKNQTECAPCEEGTYTEKENSLPECRKCYGHCTGNSVQTVPCTPTTNRKCECARHHYCATEHATRCEQCKKCGDKKFLDDEDYYKRVCQPCPPGTFLNTTQTLRCQRHTNCTVLGKTLHTEGNSTADNYCVDPPATTIPGGQIKHDGRIETLEVSETVPCIPKGDKKCECSLGHYCATEDITKCKQCKRCGDKELLLPVKEDYYNRVCQPCPPGTFLNTTQTLKCQPHTNCTVLGKTTQTEGNSTVNNYCVDSEVLEEKQHRKDKSSFSSYMVWVAVSLSVLCAVILVKSSLCKTSNKQGIGLLVKLKFICICGTKSDLFKSSDEETEKSIETRPETGEQCVDESACDSKTTIVMLPLISTKETETPTLEYKTEILDIETVSGVVHTKDSTEDNIPFPVQEHGRNSNTYYPIEEQSRKQYYQLATMEAKYGTQTSLQLASHKYQLQCIAV